MNSEMERELKALLGSVGLNRRSASHPSDRQKLLDFFIRWHNKGEDANVADFEALLLAERWDRADVSDVMELPGDLKYIARHL
jgi:hypothetical protein